MARRHKRQPHVGVPRHQHDGAEWEAVWQGKTEADSVIVAGGLQADGIRARPVVSRTLPSVMPHMSPAEAWAVFVPRAQAERARHILRRRGNGVEIVESERDFSSDQRATLKFAVLGILAVVAFALYQVVRNSL